jgi:hypothetical protein
MEFGDLRPKLDHLISLLKEIGRNTNDNSCCVASTSAGVNINVPAGFASASVALTSGSINVTMSDGSIYPMTTVGEVLVQAALQNEVLPSIIIISGPGTWKWSAIK